MNQLGHAEGGVDHRSGAVGVLVHGDVDGHGAIAVDQVIATPAGDDVAAGAAEDDVTGPEGGDARPQELLQPGDQADVGEDAAVHPGGGNGRRIAVVTLEDVAVARPREAFHELEAGQQGRGGRSHRGLVEGPQVELDVDPLGIVAEHRPVEAGAADIAVTLAAVAEHDVVTALAVHAVDDAALADVHIVAGHVVQAELVEVVTGVAVGSAQFQPVVALVAELRLVGAGAEDEVVAHTAEDLGGVLTGHDEVVAEATEDQVDAIAAMDDVVAAVALDVIVAATVGDDVVAVAGADQVVAVTTLDAVVARVAPDGVVTDAGDHDVIAIGATQHHVLVAGVAQVVGVGLVVERGGGIVGVHRVVTDHPGQQGTAAFRIGATIDTEPGELLGLVHLQDESGRREDIPRQVLGVGGVHHHLGERVVLQFGEEVHARRALQVIEAVAVLEFLQLVFEHEVEGRAQQTAEGHLLLGQAANPEVHQVQASLHAGPGAIAVEELQPVSRRAIAAEHQGEGRSTLVRRGGRRFDAVVGPVGRDEVDDGGLVLQVRGEVDPTGVGAQLAVTCGVVELLPCEVERRHASFPSPCQVDGRQVQGQAQQVVAQRLGDELVDLVAGLAGHAPDDIACSLLRTQGTVVVEGDRVQEGIDQVHAAGIGVVRTESIHGFSQHRVTEAIHHVGELGDDGRVDLGVVHLGGVEEHIHLRLHLAGELLEHQVLVLHLGAEAGSLEQPLAIPAAIRQLPLGDEGRVVAGQHHLLDVLHHAVVLEVEHMVHRGQADVLVATAIAGDEVAVEQLVVEEAGQRRVPGVGIGIRRHQCASLAIERIGRMGDVIQEGMTGEQGIPRNGHTQPAIGRRITLQEGAIVQHDLGEAVGSRDELAIEVGSQQRDVGDIGIRQLNAQHLCSLGLDLRPGRQPTCSVQHMAGRHRVTVGVQLVLPQEHLVRRVGGVGLVLVDEGRGLVVVQVHIVRGAQLTIHTGIDQDIVGPGQDHEVGGAALDIERIVRLQRDEDEAVVALVHQVQAMVEELAEQGEPGVEAGGQPFVRRGVGDEQRLAGGNRHAVQVQQHAIRVQGTEPGIHIGLHRRRVGDGLVHHQVGDDARIGVHHIAGHRSGGGVVIVGEQPARNIRPIHVECIVAFIAEVLVQQEREGLVGCAEVFLARHQVVEGAIHGTQAEGATGVGQDIHQVLTGGMALGDNDLVQDELQVAADQVHAGAGDEALLRGCRRRGHHHGAIDRCGRGGEDILQHAVGVLVDRPHPQGQAIQVGGHAEGVALGGCRPLAGLGDDVRENAGPRHGLPLPEVADRAGDRASGVIHRDIVGVGHTQRRSAQHIAIHRRGVIDVQLPHGVGVKGDEITGQEGSIIELQPLDARQAIHPIGTDDGITVKVHGQVGHGDHIVAEVQRSAVVVDIDLVVGEVAREYRRVESGLGGLDDLANDHQLPGIDGAREHVGDQRADAVDAADLSQWVIGIGTDTDIGVQRQVAIDQVIPATPLDDVAAGTAEDDIAATEGGHTGAEELLQPGDQGDAFGGQGAAQRAVLGDLGGVGIVAPEDVTVLRAGQALDEGEAVEDPCVGSRHRRLEEVVDNHVGQHAEGVELVAHPVEAGAAVEVVGPFGAEEDVVTAFADHLVEAATADEDVVAGHFIQGEGREVIAGGAVLSADLDPVVAFVTGGLQVALGAVDEVVAGATEGLRHVLTGDDEVVAVTAEDQVEAVTTVDDVVAVVALDVIVAAHVGDDVVTGTAAQLVDAIAAFHAVVAGVAPEGVVTDAGDHDVIAVGAAQHHMVAAGVAQVVGVRAVGRRIVANHQRDQRVIMGRVVPTGHAQPGELPVRIHLEDPGRGREDIRRQAIHIGVTHHHLGEGVVLHLGEEVQAREARQVIEAVAVLQGFQLGLEDEVEGGTQQAAERHLFLGQATDPEVHQVQAGGGHAVGVTGPGTGAVQEVQAILGRALTAQHNGHGGGALGFDRGDAGDGVVSAIGGDEVDQGRLMLQATHEIRPTGVGGQLAVAGGLEELPARGVQ
ncbi:hypothetical protein ppKF707_1060 [Metapseudomonas furukawaii]|nr:hypothetical protein ppKF707_1060 [Pseudomonas furukawaii]